ncbi:MAG: TIGR02391 family protein [Methanosarcina barkeri]|nr:TIGR02391 family protein [Methanosarcina sp. ERenArc_MAG2]
MNRLPIPVHCLHADTTSVSVYGDYAVFEAAKIYHQNIQSKSQSMKEGQDLMLQVWNPKNGTLKVTKCISSTDKNVQEGIAFLSAGLMRAIRNPTAHEPAHLWPITKEECLDILSFVSFLMKKLDEAVYYFGSAEGHEYPIL